MPDEADAPTPEQVTAADVLVLFGLLLVTIGLVAIVGWAVACLVDGAAFIALGVNRAHTTGNDR